MDWFELVSYGIGILGIAFGAVFLRKYELIVALLKEFQEAFTATSKAMEDKKVTKEELIECLKEWSDVFTQILMVLPKSMVVKIWRR